MIKESCLILSVESKTEAITQKKPREKKFDSRSFVQMLSKEIAKNNKKSKKRKRSRRHSGSSASSDDSSWHDGSTSQVRNLDDTLVNKTKRLRLDTYSSIFNSPIKASYTCRINEQVHKRKKNGKTTAVLGFPYHKGLKIKGSGTHNSNNRPLWRVLLDSGSDGDLLFQKKRQKDSIPYYPLNIPKFGMRQTGFFAWKIKEIWSSCSLNSQIRSEYI